MIRHYAPTIVLLKQLHYQNTVLDEATYLNKSIVCYTLDNYIQLCSDNSIFMDELRGKAESFNTMKVLFLYTK